MRNALAATLIFLLALVIPQSAIFALQQPENVPSPSPEPATPQPAAASLPPAAMQSTSPLPGPELQTQLPQENETLVLHRGTAVCLRPAHRLSTRRTKSGDDVTFRLHGDVSAEGLIVAVDGAEVTARVTKSRKPGYFARRGKLAFEFDDLHLVNGQSVALEDHRAPKTPPSPEDIIHGTALVTMIAPFAAPLLPFTRGMEVTLDEDQCVEKEIGRDVVLDKAAITRVQPQGRSWKARFRQMAFHSAGGLDAAVAPPQTNQTPAGNDIMQFDFISGQERRLGECRHCYSPVACPLCFEPTPDNTKILFLQADGLYLLIAHPVRDTKRTSQDKIFNGSFSRILGVLGADLVLLETSTSSCKLVLLNIARGRADRLDEMDCNEVTPGYAQEATSGIRSPQLLEGQFAGDIGSPPSGRAVVFTLAASGPEANLTPLPLQDPGSYNRFDPAWIDPSHIVYVRNKR